MLARLLAGSFALGLAVSSTAVGGVGYLCLMDGQLHDECCCSAPKPPPEDRLKAASDGSCCVLQSYTTSHPPARAEAASLQDLLPPVLALLPGQLLSLPRASAPVPSLAEARGPPVRGAPRLFVRNSSYLI